MFSFTSDRSSDPAWNAARIPGIKNISSGAAQDNRNDLLAGRECPLCGGPGQPLGQKNNRLLRECRCQGPLLLSWQWKDLLEYQDWYQDEAATYHGAFQRQEGARPFWERDSEYAAAAKSRVRILVVLQPQIQRVLDIGAGTGAFVAAAAAEGWEAVGYEPSPKLAAFARERGRNVLTGGWEEIPRLPAAPDVITLHDVLEHLPDPLRCLRRIQELLAPEGLLCVEMPEWDCPLSRREGLAFRHVRPMEHLVLYGDTAAVALFQKAKLTVVAMVRPLAGSLGKIAYYLRREEEGGLQ